MGLGYLIFIVLGIILYLIGWYQFVFYLIKNKDAQYFNLDKILLDKNSNGLGFLPIASVYLTFVLLILVLLFLFIDFFSYLNQIKI